MTGSQPCCSMRVGAKRRIDILAAVKVDSEGGGMCVALDTSSVGFGLAPIPLGEAVVDGAALIVGLRDDDFVGR
ncbi:hypothetical protein ACN2CC_11120 [Mesorhizobium muleiense]|uniref:hypothetical protein n=1 Tax=Mesorhizobium muleiense TaxID=1004279 RepID=UPI003AFB79D2